MQSLWMMAKPPEPPIPSGSEASGLSGVYAVVDSSFWGSGSSGDPVFSVSYREVTGFSGTSSMEILSRLSISMRHVRH